MTNTTRNYHHSIFPWSFVEDKTLIIRKPIELLEAAVIKHLSSYIHEKNSLTPNTYIEFTMSHYSVGKFGRVALRKTDKIITELSLDETEPLDPNYYGQTYVRDLVIDYLNGHELPIFRRERLEQSWIAQDKPFGDIETWIKNVIQNGGYLELPGGFRQGDKLYTPNELYTQRKKLYNSASSILLNGLRQDNLLVKKERIEKADDTPEVQEEKEHYEPHPKWWPQKEATKRKWKADMKKISPFQRQGLNNTEIAEALQMNRKRVGRIITWWTKDTSAHI